MNSIIKTQILLLLVVSLVSCKKEIDINLPETDSKLVVNSFFTGDSKIKVHLSKSIGILENTIPECNDATVIVMENNIIIDTMYKASGYYYSNKKTAINNKYALIVSAPNMDTVLCQDMIPEKITLQSCIFTDSVLIDEDGLIINELKLDFQDSAGPDFYEVELEAKNIANNYTILTWFKKNSDPIITSTGLLDYNPKTLIFSDKMFNGKRCSVKVYYAVQRGVGNYRLKISFRSISEPYFRYKEKQYAYQFSLENDIFSGMSEPVQLYSNINGGYGIFAGYSTDEKIITVAGK